MHAQEELHRLAHTIYRKNNENNFSLLSGQKCEVIEKNRSKRGMNELKLEEGSLKKQ